MAMLNPKDSAELVYMQGGKFLIGDEDMANNPRRRVNLTAYYIYKNVVTVEQYESYCKIERIPMPPAPEFNPYWFKKKHPIVNVTWFEARAYAQWAGGDLPSEAQWERAARGMNGQKYPWGEAFDSSKCWCSKIEISDSGGTAVVGKYGMSPEGCSDMAGNVWQWCLDWHSDEFWREKESRAINPVNEEEPWVVDDNYGEQFRAMRSGSWAIRYSEFFRSAYRGNMTPNARLTDSGIRVVIEMLPEGVP